MSKQNRSAGVTTAVKIFGLTVAIAYGLSAMITLTTTGFLEALSVTVMWAFGMLAHRGFGVFCGHHYAIIEHEKRKSREEPIYWGSLIGLAILAVVLVLPLGLRSMLPALRVHTK